MQTSFLGPGDSACIIGSRMCAVSNKYYYIHIIRGSAGIVLELWNVLATTREVDVMKRPVQGITSRDIDPHSIRIVEVNRSLVVSLLSAETDSLQFYTLNPETAVAVSITLRGPKVSARINYGLINLGCQRLLLVGGSSLAGIYQTSSFIINLTQSELIKLPPLFCGVDGFALTHLNYGRIGLFGGYNKVLTQSMLYTINKGTWTEINTDRETDLLISKRWKPAVHRLSDTVILIFGGYNGLPLNDMYAYSSSSNIYTTIYPKSISPLMSREDGALILTKDKHSLVILGGGVQKCDVIYLESLKSQIMVSLSSALAERDAAIRRANPQSQSAEPPAKQLKRDKAASKSKIIEEIKAKVAASHRNVDTSLLDILLS